MAQAIAVGGMTTLQKAQLAGAIQEDRIDVPNGVAGRDENGNIPDSILVRYETAAALASIVLAEGEIAVTSDTDEIRCGDGETNGGVPVGGGGGGSSASVSVSATGTPAENAQALVDAYTTAKALTPNGAALSAMNRATVLVGPGVYDLAAAELALNLNASFVDVVGEGVGVTWLITTAAGYQVTFDQDNIRLRGLTIRYTQTGTTSYGAIRFNAGAGGSYAATNTALNIEDVEISVSAASAYATTVNASVTTFGGTYRRVRCSGANLFSAFSAASPTTAVALTVTATFERCEITGSQSSALAGGAFGGTSEGGSNTAPNVFTGIIRRCIVPGTRIGILNRGLIEHSSITCPRNSQPAVHAGNGGRFYYNRLRATGTGSPYSIGYHESATISAAFNLLGANAIDTGAGITNNVDTPYNVSDADWS